MTKIKYLVLTLLISNFQSAMYASDDSKLPPKKRMKFRKLCLVIDPAEISAGSDGASSSCSSLDAAARFSPSVGAVLVPSPSKDQVSRAQKKSSKVRGKAKKTARKKKKRKTLNTFSQEGSLQELALQLERSSTRRLHPQTLGYYKKALEAQANHPRNWCVTHFGYCLNLGTHVSGISSQLWALNLETLRGHQINTEDLKCSVSNIFRARQLLDTLTKAKAAGRELDRTERKKLEKRQKLYDTTARYKGQTSCHGLRLPGFVMEQGTFTELENPSVLSGFTSETTYRFNPSYKVCAAIPKGHLCSSMLLTADSLETFVRTHIVGSYYPLRSSSGEALRYLGTYHVSWDGSILQIRFSQGDSGKEQVDHFRLRKDVSSPYFELFETLI